LGDFGVSRKMEFTNQKANTVIGSPYYFSPELVNNLEYDTKTDIWSLGVVLYEVCSLK
jgi:NIMA (never in mitosis gene a)-related kinase